jgi:hypothetical protein
MLREIELLTMANVMRSVGMEPMTERMPRRIGSVKIVEAAIKLRMEQATERAVMVQVPERTRTVRGTHRLTRVIWYRTERRIGVKPGISPGGLIRTRADPFHTRLDLGITEKTMRRMKAVFQPRLH